MAIVEGIEIRTQPPINGFGRRLLKSAPISTDTTTIANLVHPDYSANIANWEKWRLVYNCGDEFIDEFLKKFSDRESPIEFDRRKSITPLPGFASAAIDDIKNAIFQRMTDITRQGGPMSYLDAAAGNNGGVDLQNSTMNWFIGTKIIPDLLTMAKIGVYVDAPPIAGPTLADRQLANHPYLYPYSREDIRSWAYDDRGNFVAVLLRDWIDETEPQTGLPIGRTYRFRLCIIDQDYKVTVAFFDKDSKLIGSRQLNLPIIPFVPFSISKSLLSTVANHQIALANLESNDLSWLLKAGYPFYTEQRDSNFNGSHFKKANIPAEVADNVICDLLDDGDEEIRTGSGHGRVYGKDLERPGFIHPSSEPLTASMSKQKQLKDDIRLLVNLSLSNVKSIAASAESKAADLQGLESGLSQCGLELEHGERQIAYIWSLYEGMTTSTTIKYPRNYSLKSDQDRLNEAKSFENHLFTIPSKTYRKATQRKIAKLLIGNDVSDDDLKLIESEINDSEVATSDPAILLEDVREGLVSKETASRGRGYTRTEVKKASKEHLNRLKQIAIAQTPNMGAARGLPDLSANPTKEAAQEKEGLPKRGEAK